MKNKFNLKIRKLGRIATRVLCLALCATVVVTMMPMPDQVFAGKNESEKKQDEYKEQESDARKQEDASNVNYYNSTGRSWTNVSTSDRTNSATKDLFLIVTNGITVPQKGDIEYFTVSYIDTMGCLRAVTFDPEKAFDKAKFKANAATTLSYGNTETRSLMSLNINDKHDIYTPYATEIYQFSIYEDFVEFAGLTVKTNSFTPRKNDQGVITGYDPRLTAWTIEDIKIVEADTITGWMNAGYYSSMNWIGYKGMNLAEGKTTCEIQGLGSSFQGIAVPNVNVNPTVSLINNSSWKAANYRSANRANITSMLRKNLDSRSLLGGQPLVWNTPANKEAIYEDSTKVSTFAGNITLGDFPMGGIEAFNTVYSTNDMQLALAECLYADICYTTNTNAVKHVQYPIIANSMAWFLDSYKDQQNVEIHGKDMISFAQQGENIPFYFALPLMDHLNYIIVTYTGRNDGSTGRDFTESALRKYYCSQLNQSTPSAVTLEARKRLIDQNVNMYYADTDEVPDYTESDSIYIAGMQFYQDVNIGTKANSTATNYIYLDVNHEDFAKGWNVNPTICGNGSPVSIYKSEVLSTGYCPGRCVDLYENMQIVPVPTNMASLEDEELYQEVTDHDFLYDTSGYRNLKSKEEVGSEWVNPYSNKAPKDKFLIEVTTSNPKNASTDGEAFVSLRYYTETGKEVATGKASLSGKSSDLYGYWPGARVATNDAKVAAEGYSATSKMGYYKGVEAGNTYQFIVDLNNLSYTDGEPNFKSITFSLAETANDWQIENFRIYKVSNLKGRTTQHIAPTAYNKWLTNRVYERNIVADLVYASESELKDLITMGGYTTIALNGARDEDDTWGSIERDYDDVMNSMPLEFAKKNLNFTYALKTYHVVVSVPRNSKAAVLGDSCGSANYFYFQLIFEKGKSAYVLANKQIDGDYFIAGEDTEFTIKTNYDYGDLLSINIIADDSTEGIDHNDKLCIDKIRVVKGTTTGIKRQWVISSVGWIGPIAENDSYNTQESNMLYHLEGELAKNFEVDYSSLVMSLEFRISYGSESQAFGQMTDAHITADLEYQIEQTINDAEDIGKLRNIQVVDRMYEYQLRQPRLDSDENGVGTGKVISDNDTMLRANTADRFVLDMENFAALHYITLKFSTAAEAEVNIAQIDVFIIQSGGKLMINDNNEYEVKYKQQPIALDSTSKSKSMHTAGDWVPFAARFDFEGNQVPDYVNEDTPIRIVDRVPASINDNVNILVKLHYDERNRAYNTLSPTYIDQGLTKERYHITAELTYKVADQTNPVMSRTVLKPEANDTLLTARGIRASKISSIESISLYSDTLKTPEGSRLIVWVDGITIQQMRDGVVLNTYYFNANNNIAAYAVGKTYSSAKNARDDSTSKQKIYVMLKDKQNYDEAKPLVPPDEDVGTGRATDSNIGVAFVYTSTKDATETQYTTKTVYATDFGATSVAPGQLLYFELDEPYVREIKYLLIKPSGALTVSVERALVVNCDDVDGIEQTSAQYSFAQNVDAGTSKGIGSMKCTSNEASGQNTVQLVDIDFFTANTATGADGGTKTADIILNYTAGGKNPELISEKVSDIRNHTDKSSPLTFVVSDRPQTVRLLAANLGDIRYINIVPRSEDQTGAWTISKIQFTKYSFTATGTQKDTKVITPNKTCYENPMTGNDFNFANISVDLSVSFPGGTRTVKSSDNATPSIKVYKGEVVTVNIDVTGSMMTTEPYAVKVVELTGTGSERDAATSLYKIENNKVIFTVPNDAPKGDLYRVTVYSKELDTVKASIIIETDVKATT